MIRVAHSPRANWQALVEAQGLVYHGGPGRPYWDESAYYLFSAEEVDQIEAATAELNRLCLEACQRIIDENRFADLGIPEPAVPMIRAAWEEEPPSLYGRMDLAYGGTAHPPKLLEFNADTPTSLLEAAVIQWYWLQDRFPDSDQFNSIHERLLAKWKELKGGLLKRGYLKGEMVHFACLPVAEDVITTHYLRDLAAQAGIKTEYLTMAEIGFDSARGLFVDKAQRPILSIFKLYPWEWMFKEEFAARLPPLAGRMDWMEPIWKMLLSNKAVLALLWEYFPDHPNLLPAYLDGPRDLKSYVVKPRLGREGENLAIHQGGRVLEKTGGDYDTTRPVHQAYHALPDLDGYRPVVGSWVIDQQPAGMGIRETRGFITRGDSSFVPHRFL